MERSLGESRLVHRVPFEQFTEIEYLVLLERRKSLVYTLRSLDKSFHYPHSPLFLPYGVRRSELCLDRWGFHIFILHLLVNL